MKQFAFKKIDAFASKMSAGNPAAMITLQTKDEMDEDEMQRVAKELKGFVSEVGFAFKEGPSALHLRFFSSEREVDFCGHAIIAILYEMLRSDEAFARHPRIDLRTNKGSTWVENRFAQDDAVFIWAPKPDFAKSGPSLPSTAAALGLALGDCHETLPCSVVDAGLKTLIVPLASLESLLALKPDQEKLRLFCVGEQIHIITCFSHHVIQRGNDFHSRVFAPIFGYLEDPATGSGNAALGYYLRKNRCWEGNDLVVEQNDDLERFNRVMLQLRKDEDGEERVLFGGSAVTRIAGTYFLSSSTSRKSK